MRGQAASAQKHRDLTSQVRSWIHQTWQVRRQLSLLPAGVHRDQGFPGSVTEIILPQGRESHGRQHDERGTAKRLTRWKTQ